MPVYVFEFPGTIAVAVHGPNDGAARARLQSALATGSTEALRELDDDPAIATACGAATEITLTSVIGDEDHGEFYDDPENNTDGWNAGAQ